MSDDRTYSMNQPRGHKRVGKKEKENIVFFCVYCTFCDVYQYKDERVVWKI
jgi:hypothetical protein